VWTTEFAERAILEYKRFIYLAAISAEELTPSIEIDQVWHLHLLYTRSYRELCSLSGTFIHHGPTKGGGAERSRFHGQYRNTLKFYEQVFGVKPPNDIWPPPSVRFGGVKGFRWVDLDKCAIVPRQALRRTALGLMVAGVIIIAGRLLALVWA
jgi:hypothetical protein